MRLKNLLKTVRLHLGGGKRDNRRRGTGGIYENEEKTADNNYQDDSRHRFLPAGFGKL